MALYQMIGEPLQIQNLLNSKPDCSSLATSNVEFIYTKLTKFTQAPGTLFITKLSLHHRSCTWKPNGTRLP